MSGVGESCGIFNPAGGLLWDRVAHLFFLLPAKKKNGLLLPDNSDRHNGAALWRWREGQDLLRHSREARPAAGAAAGQGAGGADGARDAALFARYRRVTRAPLGPPRAARAQQASAPDCSAHQRPHGPCTPARAGRAHHPLRRAAAREERAASRGAVADGRDAGRASHRRSRPTGGARHRRSRRQEAHRQDARAALLHGGKCRSEGLAPPDRRLLAAKSPAAGGTSQEEERGGQFRGGAPQSSRQSRVSAEVLQRGQSDRRRQTSVVLRLLSRLLDPGHRLVERPVEAVERALVRPQDHTQRPRGPCGSHRFPSALVPRTGVRRTQPGLVLLRPHRQAVVARQSEPHRVAGGTHGPSVAISVPPERTVHRHDGVRQDVAPLGRGEGPGADGAGGPLARGLRDRLPVRRLARRHQRHGRLRPRVGSADGAISHAPQGPCQVGAGHRLCAERLPAGHGLGRPHGQDLGPAKEAMLLHHPGPLVADLARQVPAQRGGPVPADGLVRRHVPPVVHARLRAHHYPRGPRGQGAVRRHLAGWALHRFVVLRQDVEAVCRGPRLLLIS